MGKPAKPPEPAPDLGETLVVLHDGPWQLASHTKHQPDGSWKALIRLHRVGFHHDTRPCVTCDYHDDHDLASDTPRGHRCGARATHRIEWDDGRFSFSCAKHLEIDPSASVKPSRVVPLSRAPEVKFRTGEIVEVKRDAADSQPWETAIYRHPWAEPDWVPDGLPFRTGTGDTLQRLSRSPFSPTITRGHIVTLWACRLGDVVNLVADHESEIRPRTSAAACERCGLVCGSSDCGDHGYQVTTKRRKAKRRA